MRSKVMSYLGFAAKAGKIVNGYNTCMFMMEKKKVKLVILANDLAENSIKKMISLAGRYRVPYRIFGTMERPFTHDRNCGEGHLRYHRYKFRRGYFERN